MDERLTCLALLKGNKAGMLCKGLTNCKISGHAQTRAANPLQLRYYIIILDEESTNICTIFAEGFELKRAQKERGQLNMEGEKKLSS
eukprot:1937587-Ditylum_brightwellii.AAC.2